MRRSAPPSSRCVANEWRRVCGLTRSASPAAVGRRLDRGPRLLPREPPPAVAEEHRAAARPARRGARASSRTRGPSIQRAEPVERDVADRHEALLVALADDPDEPAVGREVLLVEAEAPR